MRWEIPGATPLQRQSVLVIDDDNLASFRLHRHLTKAGARVASGRFEASEPYLEAAALAAVVVATGLNATDWALLQPRLQRLPAPWIAYGAPADASASTAAAVVAAGAVELLIDTLAALVGGPRH